MFVAPWFILGGVAAAAGVILIHLLHRRRFRVVHWAAMEFLLQAARRSRRMIELRDWLLLLLRVACLLLFAIGMARPHWGRPGASGSRVATHLLLVLDNSLSMNYQLLGRSLWAEAQDRAQAILKDLPPESRVSVVPLVRAPTEVVRCDFGPPEEAADVIGALFPLDRSGDLRAALTEIADLCRRFPDPRQKRIVILSDFQRSQSGMAGLAQLVQDLPVTPEVIPIQPDVPENTWISRVWIPERYLQPGGSVRVRAWVRHEGSKPREGVLVRLLVRGNVVATQPVDLQPGQEREVEFPPYSLSVLAQQTELSWLDIQVSLPPDSLEDDNTATILLPVFKTSPILFVDQYGRNEDPAAGRYGETFFLRKLLATSFEEAAFGLVGQAVTLDELSPSRLGNTRVLVVAGVRDPAPRLDLLAHFVREGGNLVVAAGGEFDPVAWSRGCGPPYEILPGRLLPHFHGWLPLPGVTRLEPFQLDVSSLQDPCFRIEEFDDTELARFYQPVFFFQAVEVELAQSSGQSSLTSAKPASETTTQAASLAATSGSRERSWLMWRWDLQREKILPEKIAENASTQTPDTTRPGQHSSKAEVQVLARYNNGLPFMLERQVGEGRTIFITSGLFRDWNTMCASYAVVVFDRLLRRLVDVTCPRRNLATSDLFRLAVDDPAGESWQLVGPDGEMRPLVPEALEARRYGIMIRGFPRRGLYHLVRYEGSGGGGPSENRGGFGANAPANGTRQARDSALPVLGRPVEDIPLAVTGPAEESIPDYLRPEEISSQLGQSHVLVNAGSNDTLTGRSREWWPWFVLAAALGLMLEMGLLARASSHGEARS